MPRTVHYNFSQFIIFNSSKNQVNLLKYIFAQVMMSVYDDKLLTYIVDYVTFILQEEISTNCNKCFSKSCISILS